MDEKKSATYKKLVEDMQKKYPAYGTNFKFKLSGKNSIATIKTKKIASNFYDDFDDVEEFYNVLESWGLDWTKTGNNATTRMWAINSLGNAIADGFEFEKVVKKILNSPLPLWAPVVNGEIICKEINFYTYWQGLGYAEKTPKIKYLLVAQDWGNLNLSQDFVDGIKKWNDGDRTPLYTEKPIGIGTDTNLFTLFKILGYDLSKRYDELFFTNFCLGYRSGKAVGGMTKELLMNDSAEFKRLCEILQPENILCLGKITFESVFETLTGNKIKINDSYNDFVDKNPFFPANCGETASKIFPLAHCGYMGTLNRKLEKQLEDWKRILESVFTEIIFRIATIFPKNSKTA